LWSWDLVKIQFDPTFPEETPGGSKESQKTRETRKTPTTDRKMPILLQGIQKPAKHAAPPSHSPPENSRLPLSFRRVWSRLLQEVDFG
jgi:hypothetical protein